MNNFSLDVVLTGIPEPGAERNLAIAETWMGWKHAGEHAPLRWFLKDGGYIAGGSPYQFESNGVASGRYFDPSFSIAAAFQMEEAIAGQGHTSAYIRALAVVLLEDGLSRNEEDQWWRFAHATPEQRSKAALIAWAKVQAHKDGDNGHV